MGPKEKWSCNVREPGSRCIDDLGATPLRFEPLDRFRIASHTIIVTVKPTGKTEPAVEHVRADERASLVTCRLQAPGKGRHRRPEALAVLPHAVLIRQQARHDRDV